MINLDDFFQNLVESDLLNNEFWKKKIFDTNCKIHLALMVEPYLSLILNGKKTIESRFSTKKIIPFNNISSGDIVVLKKSGGALVAVFEVDNVLFKQIESENDFDNIKEEYGNELCLEDEFWKKKKDAKYVTLIKIRHLQAIRPIVLKKTNRKSWLTYSPKCDKKVDSNKVQIVCIAGKIASGKTTVASKLANAIHGEQFSISDYLKESLKKKGIENPSRIQLQEMGESYIAEGWENFCDYFLNFINYDVNKVYVIDGIRHKNFFNALCNRVYPINPVLIYLDVDEKILEQRKLERGEGLYDDKRVAEGNLIDLYNLSDFKISTSKKSISEIVDDILQLLKRTVNKKIDDKRIALHDLKEMVDSFNKNRNWVSFHNAMNLAMSINIEAAELLEIFQWSDKKEADRKARLSQNEHLREELADIFIYCINLANAYGIDISSCIVEKLQKNAKKYPLK